MPIVCLSLSFSLDWFHTSAYCSSLWKYECSPAAAEQRSECKLYPQGQFNIIKHNDLLFYIYIYMQKLLM